MISIHPNAQPFDHSSDEFRQEQTDPTYENLRTYTQAKLELDILFAEYAENFHARTRGDTTKNTEAALDRAQKDITALVQSVTLQFPKDNEDFTQYWRQHLRAIEAAEKINRTMTDQRRSMTSMLKASEVTSEGLKDTLPSLAGNLTEIIVKAIANIGAGGLRGAKGGIDTLRGRKKSS